MIVGIPSHSGVEGIVLGSTSNSWNLNHPTLGTPPSKHISEPGGVAFVKLVVVLVVLVVLN